MPKIPAMPSHAWAGFRSTLDGGANNAEAIERRQIFLDANNQLDKGTDLSTDEAGHLPELRPNTSQLFNPANRLQDVTHPDNVDAGLVAPHQAEIGPPEAQRSAPASKELKTTGRTVWDIDSFKTQSGLAPHVSASLLDHIDPLSPEAKSQVMGAFLDFTSNTIDGIGALLGEDSQGNIRRIANLIPTVEKSDRFGAQALRGLTQYAMAAVPMMGVSSAMLNGTKLAAKLPAITNIARDAIASPVADFFAFRGKEQTRVSDVVQEMWPGIKDQPYFASMLQYLESDPSDGEVEARWKNVAEGEILNVLGGIVTQPKAFFKDFMQVTKSLQNVNFIRKYIGNEVGGVGKHINLQATGQTASKKTIEEFRIAQEAPTPKARLLEQVAAIRRKGAGSPQALALNENRFKVPVTELSNLAPGQARTAEEMLALEQTTRTIFGDMRAPAEAFAVNPGNIEAGKALDKHIDDMVDTWTAYIGGGSEGGRTLQATKMINQRLDDSGVSRVMEFVQQYKTQTPDGKRDFAMAISGLPKADTGKFMQEVGRSTAAGNKWTKALSDAYVGTRFTPLSLARNGISNGIFQVGLVAERFAAATINATTPYGKASNITYSEGAVLAHGMIGSFRTAFNAFLDEGKEGLRFRHGVVEGGKFETRLDSLSSKALGFKENSPMGYIADGMGWMSRAMPAMMQAMDAGSKAMLRAGEMQALAMRHAVEASRGAMGTGLKGAEYKANVARLYKEFMDNPTPRMVKDADKFASYGTFTDEFLGTSQGGNPAGNLAKSWQDNLNAHPMAKFLFPFFRTPVRIAQAAGKRTPGLGLLMGEDTQEKIARSVGDAQSLKLAKQAVGSMVAATGAYAVSQGWLTGAGPIGDHEKKGQAVLRMNGERPYSGVTSRNDDGTVKTSFAIKDLPGPYAVAFKAFADTHEIIKKTWNALANDEASEEDVEKVQDYLWAQVEALADTLHDQTFFKGVTQIVTGMIQGNSDKVLSRFVAGLIPPLSGEAARAIDMRQKEANTLREIIMEKLPFLKDNLYDKVDVLGETYTIGVGVLDEEVPPGLAGAMSFLNPAQVQGNFRPEYQPVRAFQQEFFDKLSGLTEVKSYKGVKLNSEQRAAFNTWRAGRDFTTSTGDTFRGPTVDGQTMPERLLSIVTDPRMDDMTKVFSYNSIIQGFTGAVEVQFREAYPDWAKKADEKKATGALLGFEGSTH